MSQEISEVSEEKHIKNNPNVSTLYKKLKSKILSLGNLSIEAKKTCIGFKASKTVCDVVLQKKLVFLLILKKIN